MRLRGKSRRWHCLRVCILLAAFVTLKRDAVLCGATRTHHLDCQVCSTYLPLQKTVHTEASHLFAVLNAPAAPKKKLSPTTVLPDLNLAHKP